MATTERTPSLLIAQAVARPDRIPAFGHTGDLSFGRRGRPSRRANPIRSLRRALAEVVRTIAHCCAGPARRAAMHVNQSIKQTKHSGSHLLGMVATGGNTAGVIDPAARAMGHLLEIAGKVDADTPIDQVYRPVLALLLRRASQYQLGNLKAGILFNPEGRAAINSRFVGSSRDAEALMDCIDELVHTEEKTRELEAAAAALGRVLQKYGAATEVYAAADDLFDAVRDLAGNEQGCVNYLCRVVSSLSDDEIRRLGSTLSVPRPFEVPVDCPRTKLSLSGIEPDSRGADLLCVAMRKDLDNRLARATTRAAAMLQDGHDSSRDAMHTVQRAWDLLSNAVYVTGANQAPVTEPSRSAEALLLAAFGTQSPAAVLAYLAAVDTGLLGRLSSAAKLLPAESDTLLQDLAPALHAEWRKRLDSIQIDINAVADALLACAARPADSSAVVFALLHFSEKMGAWHALSEIASTAISVSIQDRVRASAGEKVTAAVASIRHPSNPHGPLDSKTLGRLGDLEFGAVCRAGEKLRNYGLYLSPDAVQKEAISRTEDASNHAVAQVAALASALASPGLTPQQGVYRTREMADAIRALHGLLGRLGKPVQGADAFGRYVTDIVLAGLAGMPEDVESIAVVRENLGTVIEPLLQALMVAKQQIASAETDDRVDGAVYPVAHALNIIATSTYPLSALSSRLRERDDRAASSPVIVAAASLPALLAVVPQDFPFRYQPSGEAQSHVRLRVNSAVAKPLHDAIAFLPEIGSARTQLITLQKPGQGVVKVAVDKQFYNDAIMRSFVSFTIEGMNGAAKLIHRDLSPGLKGPKRESAMNDALVALHQLAGDRALLLTAIMSQQLTGGLMAALGELGTESPLLLADGRIFQPAGAGALHFDVVRQIDASFLIKTSIRMDSLSSVTCIHPSAAAHSSEPAPMPIAVALDETSSRFSSTFSLLLAADGASMKVVEAADFRYRLDAIGAAVNRL